MTSLSVTIYVCVLVINGAYAANKCASTPNKDCSLFTFKSDLVSEQDLIDKDMMSDRWVMVYGSEFDSQQTYGICNYKWTPSASDDIIHRQLICYNSDLGKCESFDSNVIWMGDACGRVREIGVNYSVSGTFYSQDVQKYLLYYTCYNYTSPGICAVGYLDIIFRDNRYQKSSDKKLDLQGIPWHLVAADLKNNFDLEFSSQEVNFYFKGPECGFDGKVVTDCAYRQGIDCFMIVTWFYFMMNL